MSEPPLSEILHSLVILVIILACCSIIATCWRLAPRISKDVEAIRASVAIIEKATTSKP